ncbi:hypothetical protein BGZ94_002471 [Podila epigama]|nr:hypothetical protein BGZ94_002471 [Podila epigama]
MTISKRHGKYNVLVMGNTQAGKSTLIEHIKRYADPSYEIDKLRIGNGSWSKTDVTHSFSINSSLPIYEVYQIKDGKTVSLEDISTRLDKDDYDDLINTSSKHMGFRPTTQNDKKKVESIDFTIIDTPGLNDTEGRDASHAVNIITEIIRAKHFSLIIIVQSFLTLPDIKLLSALEFYADVFRGLHESIMLLYSHVDYDKMHQSDKTLRALEEMNNSLSNILRSAQDQRDDNQKEQIYPFMTISLASNNRPVVNCLNKNTIRKILLSSKRPPCILDTSPSNVERMRSINHPSKLNEKEGEAAAKHPQPKNDDIKGLEEMGAEEEQEAVGGDDLTQINILLVGDSQSGKSSLVETMKMYGDVDYKADTSRIHRRIRSSDARVRATPFISDLHTVEVRNIDDGENKIIDIEHMAKTMPEEDFEDLLYLSKKLVEIKNIPSQGKKYRYNIFEGPSLNGSGESFERNIFSIHKAIVESKKEFHQVLFILAPGPITTGIQATIRIFSNVFSELAPLLSFVHTKFDYMKLHRDNLDYMKERQEILQRYIHMKDDAKAGHFMIDCSLENTGRPVQVAMTQNTIHNILKTATQQTPIQIKNYLMTKTEKMVMIDSKLKWQARDDFQETLKEIAENNKALFDIRSEIRRLNEEYMAKDVEQNRARNNEDPTTRVDLELIFDKSYRNKKPACPSSLLGTMTFEKQPRWIEHVHIVGDNVEIVQQLGGISCNYWKTIFRHKNADAASLSVKLYAKKLGADGKPLGESPELAAIRETREDREKKLAAIEERMRCVRKLQEEYNFLRDSVLRESLPNAVLEQLTSQGVYESRNVPYDTIKDIYIKSGGIYSAASLATERFMATGSYFGRRKDSDDESDDDK